MSATSRAAVPGAVDPDETIIRAMLEEWAAAVRRRDIATVVRDRDDDMRLFDVVPPLQRHGLAEYRSTWLDQFFPWMGDGGEFRLSHIAVHAGGTAAFATAIVDCAGKEGGERIELQVRLTVGLVKRDHRWRVVHEHHSEAAESSQ